jgi:endo-1,4-beta-xylanase
LLSALPPSTQRDPSCSVSPRSENPNQRTDEFADNDYNLEYNGNKTAGAKRIVKLIKSYGLRIDGVGYQAHLASESTPTAPGATPDQKTLEAALKATSSEGVDVVYTEIDVRMNTPATPEKLKVAAAAWDRIARSCIAVKRCVGMTVWVSSLLYRSPNEFWTNE